MQWTRHAPPPGVVRQLSKAKKKKLLINNHSKIQSKNKTKQNKNIIITMSCTNESCAPYKTISFRSPSTSQQLRNSRQRKNIYSIPFHLCLFPGMCWKSLERWKDRSVLSVTQGESCVRQKSRLLFARTPEKRKLDKKERKERIEKQKEKTTKERWQQWYNQVLEDFSWGSRKLF